MFENGDNSTLYENSFKICHITIYESKKIWKWIKFLKFCSFIHL